MTRYEWLVAQLVSSTPTGCLEWPWAKHPQGYGEVAHGGRKYRSHRLAYEIAVGPIPRGLELDHLCRNRACFNPMHLEPVTHAENIRRGNSPAAMHAVKTHCPAGHPYSGVYWKGRRRCRLCDRESERRYRQRKRAA